MDDILGLGKVLPMDKLADMVSISCGRMFKSYYDKRDIDTKAYEIKALAAAYAEAAKLMAPVIKEQAQITGGIEYRDDRLTIVPNKELPASAHQPEANEVVPLVQRSQIRSEYQDALRQLNVENVVAIASEQLRDEEPVTNEPVDSDWANRFFRSIEDISNEEMQALWGRILAGEVKHPQSFSLRTLDLLKNLSKTEAEVFNRIANLAIRISRDAFVLKSHRHTFLEKYNIHYTDIVTLMEAGILGTTESSQFNIQKNNELNSFAVISGNTLIGVEFLEESSDIVVPAYFFTRSGFELLNLIDTNPPFEYLKDFASHLKRFGVKVEYGEFLGLTDGKLEHGDLKGFED